MKRLWMAVTVTCAGLAATPPALAEDARYEPSQRLRAGALDNCMKDEVMNGAYCVKQCQADFKLDTASRPPRCVATKKDAKYVPPAPEYVPPKAEAGAKGT